MIQIFLVFWLISAIMIIIDKKIVRLLIYLGIFSMVSAVCFFMLAAPDVAMAEAAISVYSTIIFVVCFEKYYNLADNSIGERGKILNIILAICFTGFLAFLFFMFVPEVSASTYLKDQYISRFSQDIGGENAVTAIYLGYRVYDTLFEALMLLVSIAGIIHLSWHKEVVTSATGFGIGSNRIVETSIRLIVPLIILFSLHLIVNGHITAGGGFQGGALIAVLFICRYIIYHINDLDIDKIVVIEKLVFVLISLVAIYFIFLRAGNFLLIPQGAYLVVMNVLVGIKIACGLLIMFYRFVIYERS